MSSTAIKRIVVRRLFGTYDYDISPSDKSENPDRLIILYGDNGTGKTTILRMLFHLLAPDVGRGHKTALGAFPFSRFDVHFTSGAQVCAQRPEGKVVGSFTIGLRFAKGKQRTAEFQLDEDGDIKPNPAFRPFMQKLSELNIGLYFLSDDRTIRLAGLWGTNSKFGAREIPGVGPSASARHRGPELRAPQLLLRSLNRATHWIQSQAVRSASLGESSVNTLYGEILKRIAHLPLKGGAVESGAVEQLEQRIAKLEGRSREYSKYGLQPEFNGKDIVLLR